MPRARASLKLKARTLAARIVALAERCVRELEESARVDPDRLSDAIELMKMAKLASRPKRRRPAEVRRPDSPPPCGEGSGVGGISSAEEQLPTHEATPRTVMRSLRAAGVDTWRAPEEALEDFIASRAPKPKRESAKAEAKRRQAEWMREKE